MTSQMSAYPVSFTAPPVQARHAGALLDRLHSKIEGHLELVERSELWSTLTGEKAGLDTAGRIVKYLMLESFSFTPHAVRSIMRAIGRFPHQHYNLVRIAMHTIVEEVPHSELALRDFVALGGDERWARSRRLTHESFVVAGTMHMLAEHESPFAYIGMMYLFESMTRELAPRAKAALEAKGMPPSAKKFVDVHAVDDIEHSIELAELIDKVVELYPEEAAAIEYGMDVMLPIYPMPLWDRVMRHVRDEAAGNVVV